MRLTLAFTFALLASAVSAEDTVATTAATISEEDCRAYGEISDQIATYRQEGKSEKRTTRLLTKGRRAVDERFHAGIPTLVSYFYGLPEDAVVPGAASEAFLSTCLPKDEDAAASE